MHSGNLHTGQPGNSGPAGTTYSGTASNNGHEPSCSVCSDSRRVDIEISLLRTSLRRTAAGFGLSKSALHRHREGHMTATLAAASDARRADWSFSAPRVRACFDQLHADTRNFFAANNGIDNVAAARALTVLTRQVEFAHRVSTSGPPAPSLGPDAFQLIGQALLETLAPHPEIRARVAASLLAVETRLGWVQPAEGPAHGGEGS